MMDTIKISSEISRQAQFQLSGIKDFCLKENEHLVIVGENGAGKSIFAGLLCGRYPLQDGSGVSYNFGENAPVRISDNIREIQFRDSTAASGSSDSEYFYQQRWNSCALDSSPTVDEELAKICASETHNADFKHKLFSLFKIDQIASKRLVMLSSGEMRRFQICRALIKAPRILILDNPFIGLDVATRDLLHGLLGELVTMGGIQLILLLSKTDDVPQFMTHVVSFENRHLVAKQTMQEWLDEQAALPQNVLPESLREALEKRNRTQMTQGETIVELRKVSIRYGERTILKELDWRISRGECWALSGENGAGKSTLLSLICADNPQAYAADIALFGRDRGTGESIWDIKRNIGYMSPEMQRGYMLPIPVIDIVASGLYDTIGVHRKVSEEQIDVCQFWMQIFGIEELEKRNFIQLSSGEQRLVLLARAFVKDPDLLILDEPLHGLDMRNRRRVIEIIETLCQDKTRSIIIVSHYAKELPCTITNSIHLKRN